MNKVVKNFLSVGFSNLLGQFATFLIVVYYARILGKSDFGSITLAQQILLYFTMTVLFGLQVYGTRLVSESEKKVENFVAEIVSFRLFIALLSFGILAFSLLFIEKNVQFKILLLLFGVSLFPMAFSLDWLFNGLQEMKHNAIFNLCKSLVPCILILLFFKDKKQIYYIPIFTIVGLFIGVLYYMYIYLMVKKWKIKLVWSGRLFKKYIKYGSPFFISGLLAMVNNNVDKIIMGFTRSEGELGTYQAAYTFIGFLINIVALLITPVFPLLISYYKQRKEKELKNLCDQLGKVIILIVTPILLGGILLSKDIILLFYKKEYIEAYKPLNILLLYIFFLFIREIYAYSLNAWDLEKKYLKIVSISSLANLVLNLLFTPHYGMIVAAWITTITELINLFFMRRCANTVVKTNYIPFLLKTFAPTGLMGFGIFILKQYKFSVICIITIGIILYTILIVLFKLIKIEEVKKFLVRKEA